MTAGLASSLSGIIVPPAQVSADLADGVLRIQGTPGPDTIIVQQINNIITVNGVAGTFNASLVQKIEVDGGAGGDAIYLNSESVSGQQALQARCLVRGGQGNDLIVGGAQSDWLFGDGGSDKIRGKGGHDFIDGGAGNDGLFGDAGNDIIYGDVGDDNIRGGTENDRLVGGAGTDHLWGGKGNDLLDGGAGIDYLSGDAGYDALYDNAGNYVFDTSATLHLDHSKFSWFDTHLQDVKLRSLARFLDRDGLTRVDMLALYGQVEHDSLVSPAEFADLQNLATGPAFLAMSDDIRNLSGKVANGNPANQHYQGAPLGNLQAGSSAEQLGKLVDKWFLGQDHPAILPTQQYKHIPGSLFLDAGADEPGQGGISYTDIRQGRPGNDDCYLLAALAETALKDWGAIHDMFTDNGDGTYAVRFFHNGGAVDYVTVDGYLPTVRDGIPGHDLPSYIGSSVYAHWESAAGNELWVALVEKAYVQLNEERWIGQDGTNAYQGIAGGLAEDSMTHITGRDAHSHSYIRYADRDAVISAFTAGQLVALGTNPDADLVTADVVHDHAYAMVGYDAATQIFTLFNPWGTAGGYVPIGLTYQFKPGMLHLTWDEIFRDGFINWHHTR